MKLKVCGITGFAQMVQLQQLGVDYAGMIFFSRSKRFVGKEAKELEQVKTLAIKKVGVFVKPTVEEIEDATDRFGLTMVQLHGGEEPEFCKHVQKSIDVMKVISLKGEENIEKEINRFADCCSYFLFDTATAEYGGSGKKFDWQVLEGAAIDKPFFLSGGIGPDDVYVIEQVAHPMLYGIDINSRFEVSPGNKDISKIETFVKQLRHG